MPTQASQAALNGLWDLTMIKWYVIPLLAIVIYIYVTEMKKARETGNWDAIFAGLTVFGMDFFNETWNGWVFHFTNHSAFWTTPGDTALRTMIGWNIEIMFMFAISGIIFYHTLAEKKEERILGLPNRWFWAIGYSVFCVFVECLLNIGGHLVWEYPFWNRLLRRHLADFPDRLLPFLRGGHPRHRHENGPPQNPGDLPDLQRSHRHERHRQGDLSLGLLRGQAGLAGAIKVAASAHRT